MTGELLCVPTAVRKEVVRASQGGPVLLVTLLATVPTVLAADTAASAVRRCGNASSSPDAPGFQIGADRLSCNEARRNTRAIIRSGAFGTRKCPPARPCHFRGYRCVAKRTTDLLYRQRCVYGRKRFSFGGGS